MFKEIDNTACVDLSDGRVIGSGATSTVYLMPDGTVCKIFNPEFSREEIIRESLIAEKTYGLGIRIPKPFGLIESGGLLGIRSEFIEGESLSSVMVSRDAEYNELLPVYIRELKHFHSTNAASCDFVCAKDLYLEKIRSLYDTSWYSQEELKKMEMLVKSVPDADSLVYGDYHPKNIIFKDGELFFVDLGDTCTGHPIFDFAMIANTHFIIPSVNPSYAEKYFDMPADLLIKLWSDLFSSYFSDYSPDNQKMIRKQIMAFAILRQGLSPADGRVFSRKVLEGNVAVAKNKLLPDIEMITGSIDW